MIQYAYAICSMQPGKAVSFVQNRLLIVRSEPCREPIEGLVEGHVLTGVGADPCVCPNVSL